MKSTTDEKISPRDIAHLQNYFADNSAMEALSSLTELLDSLEMTAAELAQMCGEDTENGED